MSARFTKLFLNLTKSSMCQYRLEAGGRTKVGVETGAGPDLGMSRYQTMRSALYHYGNILASSTSSYSPHIQVC